MTDKLWRDFEHVEATCMLLIITGSAGDNELTANQQWCVSSLCNYLLIAFIRIPGYNPKDIWGLWLSVYILSSRIITCRWGRLAVTIAENEFSTFCLKVTYHMYQPVDLDMLWTFAPRDLLQMHFYSIMSIDTISSRYWIICLTCRTWGYDLTCNYIMHMLPFNPNYKTDYQVGLAF